MASLRYKITVEGSETGQDYSTASPNRNSGPVEVANLTWLGERTVRIAHGQTYNLNSDDLLGGELDGVADSSKVHFVAIKTDQLLKVSKTNVAAEEWTLAEGGWFLSHLNVAGGTIHLENSSGAAATVLIILGGT
jgi:hypothetical protein